MEKKEKCVVFYASSEYAPGVANSIIGIEKHSPGLIDNYIYYHKDDDPIKESDVRAFKKISPKIIFRSIEPDAMSMSGSLKRWGGFLLLNFNIFDLLKEYRAVLYLEGDMLIQGDISPVFNYGPYAFSPHPSTKRLIEALEVEYRSQIEDVVELDFPACWMGIWLVQDDLLKDGINYTQKLFEIATKFEGKCKDAVIAPNEFCVAFLAAKYKLKYNLLPRKYQCVQNYFPPEKPIIVHAVGKQKFWNNRLVNLFHEEWNDNNEIWIELGGSCFSDKYRYSDVLGNNKQSAYKAIKGFIDDMQDVDSYNLLRSAVEYAEQYGSWNKRVAAKKADIVCAYGLGEYFRDSFELWDFKKIFNVNACCDKNMMKARNVAEEYGLKIFEISELVEMSKSRIAMVVVFMGNPYSVIKQFLDMGIYAVSAQECIIEKVSAMPESDEWFRDNQLLNVYQMLFDRESRIEFANVAALRIAPRLARLSYSDMRYGDGEVWAYFPYDIVHLGEDEVLCDVGAYNGVVLDLFFSYKHRTCKHAYAVEMDDGNFRDLKKRLKLLERYVDDFKEDKYTLIRAAAWDKRGIISYGKEDKAPASSYTVMKKFNIYSAVKSTVFRRYHF